MITSLSSNPPWLPRLLSAEHLYTAVSYVCTFSMVSCMPDMYLLPVISGCSRAAPRNEAAKNHVKRIFNTG